MDCWFYIPPKHFRDDVSTCNQKDNRVNCHCPDAAYGCRNDFLDAGSELRGLETTSTHPGYLQCHVPTCANYNWGWYDPADADFNTSTNPCPKPSCVALLWEAWAPGISKFCRHSGEFKMPWAGPPNMWRNSGYRRMETKMEPKTWLSRDYCLLFIMFP